MKGILRHLPYFAFVVIATLIGLEVLVRIFLPQPISYPRFAPSREYGHVYPPNTVVKAYQRGRYDLRMTMNERGFRGPFLDPGKARDGFNVLTLGDSYTAGEGVQDGEEYAAVMRRNVSGAINIVNLGVGGYGLTHHIKLFHQLGALYRPRVVVLQFCGNDPDDNLFEKVTDIENGKLVFRTIEPRLEWARSWLRQSWVQQLHLYNVIRTHAYAAARTGSEFDERSTEKFTAKQQFHVELLDKFIADLRARKIRVLLIAVEDDLDRFPLIRAKVAELHRSGGLEHVDIRPWLAGLGDYTSPEGHSWGVKAHQAIGSNLARIVAQGSQVGAAPAVRRSKAN